VSDVALQSPGSVGSCAVRGLIFDLDGTLVDSYAAITESLNAARARFGLAPLSEPEVRGKVGHGLETLVAETIGAEHVAEGVRIFRERYARVFIEQTFVLPGVPRTLEELARRGYRLSVASNKPARFGRAILESLAIAPLFDAIEGPDTVGSTKPEPSMLRRCLTAMELEPGSGLYVGDMLLDVETARRAGVAVVLVSGGSTEPSALQGTGQRLLGSFAELVELLPRVPGGTD